MSTTMMAERSIQLETSWKQRLEAEFSAPYMTALRQFLIAEKRKGQTLYPEGVAMFKAFELTPFESVSVVILGQDPYHGPNQAHGLCFSVQPGVAPPPSLVNIFKEIEADVGARPVDHGCLTPWAAQGVLLLNSVLSVRRGQAGSHQGQGWETFTDRVIEVLNDQRQGVVFLLWGGYAARKGQLIDQQKHYVLKAPHPSPLSAHRGFLGCGHFSKTNLYLEKTGRKAINWQLPERAKLESF